MRGGEAVGGREESVDCTSPDSLAICSSNCLWRASACFSSSSARAASTSKANWTERDIGTGTTDVRRGGGVHHTGGAAGGEEPEQIVGWLGDSGVSDGCVEVWAVR